METTASTNSSKRTSLADFVIDSSMKRPSNISDGSVGNSRDVSQWTGKTLAGKNIRISSQIFSSARNFRMNQIYKYDENIEWTFENSFEYKTKFIKAMMEENVEKLRPTDAMLNFIPEPSNIMFQSEKQKQRLIFYTQDYDFDNTELQVIMEFKIWSITNDKKLPDRDEEILRNLYARAYDKEQAFNALKFKIDYQKEHFPITIDNNIAELMNQGMIYIFGRDRCFRPIVHINAKKLLDAIATHTNKELVSFVILLSNYLDHFMMVEGRIENVQIIIDCAKISIFNFPYTLLKDVLGTIQGLFKCKAKSIYCLNVPKSFSVLWNTVSLFLDACTVAKVQIISENTCSELLAQILPEQLQKQYGGISKDKEEDFWPPQCPTKLFGHNIAQIRVMEKKRSKHSVRAAPEAKGMRSRPGKGIKKTSRLETELPLMIEEEDEEMDEFQKKVNDDVSFKMTPGINSVRMMTKHPSSQLVTEAPQEPDESKPPMVKKPSLHPEVGHTITTKAIQPRSSLEEHKVGSPNDIDGFESFIDEIEANVSDDENAVNQIK